MYDIFNHLSMSMSLWIFAAAINLAISFSSPAMIAIFHVLYLLCTISENRWGRERTTRTYKMILSKLLIWFRASSKHLRRTHVFIELARHNTCDFKSRINFSTCLSTCIRLRQQYQQTILRTFRWIFIHRIKMSKFKTINISNF